jgi:CRP/FNR family transcriptional regulator, anaerobic regulatory protein
MSTLHALPAHRSTDRLADLLERLQRQLPGMTRQLLHEDDVLYRSGARLQNLYVIRSGMFKTTTLSADGREQLVGLHFRGDWLGFDGLASRQFRGDAIAMDIGEVWAVPYPALLEVCMADREVMTVVHEEMSRQISRDHDSMLARCSLPADARVANFLHDWAASLDQRGLRSDRIKLRLTRAEIGNFLGMALESVSRALSRLAKEGLISFPEHDRRELHLPDVTALARFVHDSIERGAAAPLKVA